MSTENTINNKFKLIFKTCAAQLKKSLQLTHCIIIIKYILNLFKRLRVHEKDQLPTNGY